MRPSGDIAASMGPVSCWPLLPAIADWLAVAMLGSSVFCT